MGLIVTIRPYTVTQCNGQLLLVRKIRYSWLIRVIACLSSIFFNENLGIAELYDDVIAIAGSCQKS